MNWANVVYWTKNRLVTSELIYYNDFGLGGRKLGNFASLRHQGKEKKMAQSKGHLKKVLDKL